MRNTKNAFTLVELIVVITILAILGTIAFISLQGYSADARNSKRSSDIGNIRSAISLKQVEGVSLLSFVVWTGSNLTGISLGWTGAVKYAAGTPSYTVINVAAKDFKDPNDKEYRVWVTEDRGWAFQIAATMEVDSTDTSLVNGTYVARGSGTVAISAVDWAVITIPDSSANFFKAGDTIAITGTGTATSISKVSRDGVTITLNQTDTLVTDTLNLAAPESAGLIRDKTTATTAVVNNSTTTLAY